MHGIDIKQTLSYSLRSCILLYFPQWLNSSEKFSLKPHFKHLWGLTSNCMIWIVHELEWVLLYFLNVKHYFLKNEQVEKEEKSSNNSRKIKGKRINKLNVRFWNQYEKIHYLIWSKTQVCWHCFKLIRLSVVFVLANFSKFRCQVWVSILKTACVIPW